MGELDKLIVVVAKDAQQYKDWCAQAGVDRNRTIYARTPDKLYGLDETLVEEVVELTSDHPMFENRRYIRLKAQVEEFRNRKPPGEWYA